MRTLLTLTLTLTLSFCAYAQKHQARLKAINVQHYAFDMEISDASDEIKGIAQVDVKFRTMTSAFVLDLVAKGENGKGMTVEKVVENGKSIKFEHAGESLKIFPTPQLAEGVVVRYTIHYAGVPADGLIIAKNKHGDRTFFGDNWPDRARHWVPVVDHPSDKATVEWIVTAPNHYQVIANGSLIEETDVDAARRRTHYKTDYVLPTKVMVIGAAAFAVNLAGHVGQVPVTSWVYPQDRDKGFHDYAQATKVLEWFITTVGDYPYRKLANVQSKTRYGGMENASNIFYFENSVTGNRSHEDLIAHEIAHQWFGNSASEGNWHHVWLSEGFATYLTDMYLEAQYGRERFVNRMKDERKRVVAYATTAWVPIVNPAIEDYNQLLNANSYQKGAWVLHMLRHKIGDEKFKAGLRAYYQQFKFGNALTKDFKDVMETTSGLDLGRFFTQWIFQPGHPQLQVNYRAKKKEMTLKLKQTQKETEFQVPVDVLIEFADPSLNMKVTVQMDGREAVRELEVPMKPVNVVVDPDCWLLHEATVQEGK